MTSPHSNTLPDNNQVGGKFNRNTADEPRINRFKEFLRGKDIAFSDITVSLLKRFATNLKSTREISECTIINHLVVIRSIFSQAIGSEIVDAKYYPFGKSKIRIKFPDSAKLGLTKDEVLLIENAELAPNSPVNHARNLWLFSFYFAGMRLSDILRLRWSDFQNDRLHYTMGKNQKTGSLKIPEKVRDTLKQYESEKRSDVDLIFPHLKMLPDLSDAFLVQKKIKNADHRLNAALRALAESLKLKKHLTMHIARHTFGNISGDKIPIQMLQKLYRHTSITTAIGYQANFMHKDTVAALDAVVGF